jgi:hypothetical protein
MSFMPKRSLSQALVLPSSESHSSSVVSEDFRFKHPLNVFQGALELRLTLTASIHPQALLHPLELVIYPCQEFVAPVLHREVSMAPCLDPGLKKF